MMTVRGSESAVRSKMDWALVGAAIGLVMISSIAILSSGSTMNNYTQILQKHGVGVIVGVFAFLFGFTFNYQIYQDQAKTLYGLMVLAVIAVLVIGVNIRGHRSWIRMPFFNFQPSEFARVVIVLVLANYLDRNANRIEGRIGPVFGAAAIVAPIMLLVLIEPDFGSALVYFPIMMSMLFCAGANLGYLTALIAFGGIVGTMPIAWTLFSLRPDLVAHSRIIAFLYSISRFNAKFAVTIAAIFVIAYLVHKAFESVRVHIPLIFCMAGAAVVSAGLGSAAFINHHIKEHQRNRFVAFVAPQTDPQGIAYNVNQALVAIGSGGIAGKGIFSAPQTQLGFLPERHTDFIFAVIGEEMGFLGAMVVLMLYLTLLWRIVSAARLSRDRYGYLVCCGLATSLGFYVLVNMGMCLGVVPVAGIPLPLLSYGNSSLVMTLWALGITANIYSKRFSFT